MIRIHRGNKPCCAVLGLIALLLLPFSAQGAGDKEFRTATIDRGDIRQSVAATGIINPVSVVNVGTQVSGIVTHLSADFNDAVEKDQILAQLDPALFETQLRQSKASLSSANASLRLAEANLRRARELYAQHYIARAELERAEQEMANARSQSDQASAQVERDKVNLQYTVIRSPVSGIVMSREVDVGQTVAASFQTPVLFKIAQDMKQMQISINLSEADVGMVRPGIGMTFKVDAYADRTFDATLKQIRLNPTSQQNVVTYNAIASVDNRDLLLYPGMTAFVTINVAEKKDAVRLPNAALRFRPDNARELAAALPSTSAGAEPDPAMRTLYVVRGKALVPVSVKVGATDGRYTEMVEGAISVGDVVATDYKEEKDKN